MAKKPKEEKNDLKIEPVEEELKGAEKIKPEKKEEKPAETPKEPEKPKEETASASDIINDLYNQLEVIGKTLVNVEKEINALKMNQVWLQEYITNALKATEVPK